MCLQKQKKPKLSCSYFETSYGSDNDVDCVHKKVVERLRTKLYVSFVDLLLSVPVIGYISEYFAVYSFAVISCRELLVSRLVLYVVLVH